MPSTIKKNANNNQINLIKIDNQDLNLFEQNNYLVREITPEGNCFYRCLSYFYG